MEWVNNDNRIPIKSWCKDVETGAMLQATNLANLPFAFKHIALMPDCHSGYGMPIGGVLATKGVVVPNAVGVDIGCGMCFIRTEVPMKVIKDDPEIKQRFIDQLKQTVPIGFLHYDEPREWAGFDMAPDVPVIKKELDSARYQLGTLGGGNHFIELQVSDAGNLCLMVHSGSRNFGYKIAKEYNKKAQELCTKWYSNIPPYKGEDGLAFLPVDTQEYREYMEAMRYALDFALESRKRMLAKAVYTLAVVLKLGCIGTSDPVNIHHNFAAWENHFGKNVIVHRKGATQAKKGQLGIIPGSMGTSSYIVRGLGNPQSFESCSHGAGRVMARGEANRTLTMDAVNEAMGDTVFEIGVDRKGRPDLSEAPQAYKDIDTVIAAEADLVEVVTRLKPLAVLKG